MTSGRSLLLIADIGGYTEYMRSHRMSLAHAEVNTARLLEKVIDAVPDFDLIEIEGDAAFLARQADTLDGDATVALTLQAAMAMHRAFHLERQYVATNLCPCNGCTQANNLKLKFVAHIGEVATQTIRQRRKLVGIDVILVHRLLKNPVEVPEYVLLSEELYRTARHPDAWSRARGVSGPRGDRPGSGVLRGRRGPPGLTPSAAGSVLARTRREDLGRRRLRHAVHAGPTPPAPYRLRFLTSRSDLHSTSANGSGRRPPRLLGVFAHPDDETLCAGGTFAKYAERRRRRPGDLVHQGWSGPDQRRPRGDPGDLDEGFGRRSSTRPDTELGLTETRCLDHPDGGLAQIDGPSLVRVASELLSELDPDVVITFGPDGFSGHPDHIAVGAAVTAACFEMRSASIDPALPLPPAAKQDAAPRPPGQVGGGAGEPLQGHTGLRPGDCRSSLARRPRSGMPPISSRSNGSPPART